MCAASLRSSARNLIFFRRELIAIDGSKLKAVNSQARHFSEKKLQQRLQHSNDRLDAYRKALDAQDTVEAQTTQDAAKTLQEKIAQ
jgi:hypothetical protein